MKIPKSLNIFSLNYKVIVEPDYFIGFDKETLLVGEYDPNEKIIRVKKSADEVMLNTLLHEVIHTICFELVLFKEDHDEEFIDRLALGLTDTLIRNKFIKE